MKNKYKNLPSRIFKKTLQLTLWKSDFLTWYLFKKKYISVTESSDQKLTNETNEFNEKLASGKVTKIKLVGDSITAGVGVISYHTNNNPFVIYDNQGEIYKESPHTVQAWGNYFRNFIHLSFPGIKFENFGIGGKSTKWLNNNKAHLISNNEDVVFVMTGTNDRWDTPSLDEYKQHLKELLSYINDRSELMYVFCPPPALNDGRFSYGMKEINAAVKEICEEHNYYCLSHFDNLMDYSTKNNISLKKLLETSGSHPIQKGHDEMWRYIIKELNLND